MIEWFKRQSLIREGLASGKTRRRCEGDFKEAFESNWGVRCFILLFAYLAVIRIALWESERSWIEIASLGILFMGATLILLHTAGRRIWDSNQLMILFLGSMVANLLINRAAFLFLYKFPILGESIANWLVPAAFAPMLAGILISYSAGLLTAVLLSILGLLFLQTPTGIAMDSGFHSAPGLFMSSILMGFAAAHFSQKIRTRSDLLMTGVAIGFVGFGCAMILGGLQKQSLTYLAIQGTWAFTLGLMTSFIVSATLPILEWLFDRITDVTWLELTDLNHPLLRRMSLEAPGTYQHSLMVANLAESAAEAIGANPTQCRASAYFHDIGKLVKPSHFVENRPHEFDPHEGLTPSMSALIIVSHVKEGVDLAIKHKLRQPIVDVIQQHHGRSLVTYFYRRALQMEQDARAGGKILNLRSDDVPEVDETSFRYPGPVPQFRECALISLADAVESASRTLKNPTPQRIESMVREIVQRRMVDGELDQSKLTFNDLNLVIERFTFTLKTMLHARIEYPKDPREKEREDQPWHRPSDMQQTRPVSTQPPAVAASGTGSISTSA